MSRPAPQLAYVLHRYDWSETSLILDVLTREAGRVALVARGAKRPYSQLRSVLLPFQRLWIGAGARRNPEAEVMTLRSAEWAQGGAMLTGALLFSGFYLNELLMRLLPRQDPHPVLFDAYDAMLSMLHVGESGEDSVVLRAFELALLRQLGVLPALDLDTITQQPVGLAQPYTLHPDRGLMAAPSGDGGVLGAVWVALEAALRVQDWPALVRACRPQRGALRGVLRTVLYHQLGTQVLHVRQVAVALRRTMTPEAPAVSPSCGGVGTATHPTLASPLQHEESGS